MPPPIALIVNPAAGGGRASRALAAVEAALSARGDEFHTERTLSAQHARELGAAAAAANELAITLGGDGLIGCVAGPVSDAGGLMAVLPGGRGNDFARMLGLPLDDPVAALGAVLDGSERPVDLGEVDGRVFVGIASGGFDSVANRIANDAKLVKGDLVYAYAALRALAGWKPARFTLELDDGESISYAGFSFAAANARFYGGGMMLAPEARLNDGLLDVVATGRAPRRRFLASLPRVFDGSHVDLPSVRVMRTRELRVSADRPFTVYADGDPIGELPVTIRVRPGTLRVLGPR